MTRSRKLHIPALCLLAVGLAMAPVAHVGADEVDPFLIPVSDGPSEADLQLQKRHNMLQVHQAVGYGTLGLLTAQVALGWALFYDKKNFRSSIQKQEKLRKAHLGMGVAAFTSYWTGASLAIFAPKLEDEYEERDTISVHRRLAWVHGIGMGLMPVAGYLISERAANFDTDEYNLYSGLHGAGATVTYGALLGAYISVAIK